MAWCCEFGTHHDDDERRIVIVFLVTKLEERIDKLNGEIFLNGEYFLEKLSVYTLSTFASHNFYYFTHSDYSLEAT